MKKRSLILSLSLFFVSLATFAQKSSTAFEKGTNLLNVGFGVGSPYFTTGYSSSFPINPTIAFEHGFTDAISIGGQASYASSKYNYNYGLGGSGSYTSTAIYVGARGSYHFNELLGLDPKFDVYGGATVGYVILSESDNYGSTIYANALGSNVGVGAFAAGKYYFTSGIAAYTEVGYQSLSLLNVGITFKF